jgi:hypothetical protein
MATRKQVIDELNYLTEVISTRVRTITGGILAFCWLFVIENSYLPAIAVAPAIILSFMALSFDIGQYVAGYFFASADAQRDEENRFGGYWI